MMHRGQGMFGFGGILCLIIIVITAYLLIRFFNQNRNNSNISKQDDKAIEILNSRFAKGEIDEEEYNEKKRTINS